MREEAVPLINDITASHQVAGSLCYEAENSFIAENYMAALACLFIVVEICMKYKLDIDSADKYGLHKAIEESFKLGVIDNDEQAILFEIKKVRNGLFHNDYYEQMVAIDNLLYPFYEEDTKQVLYERYSLFVFELTKKVVSSR